MNKIINQFKNSRGETVQVYPLCDDIKLFVNTTKGTIKTVSSEICSEETLYLLKELKISLN